MIIKDNDGHDHEVRIVREGGNMVVGLEETRESGMTRHHLWCGWTAHGDWKETSFGGNPVVSFTDLQSAEFFAERLETVADETRRRARELWLD